MILEILVRLGQRVIQVLPVRGAPRDPKDPKVRKGFWDQRVTMVLQELPDPKVLLEQEGR